MNRKQLTDKLYYEKNKEKIIAQTTLRRNEFQEDHKLKGLCICCHEPAVVGKVLCDKHRKNMSSRDKQRCERLGILYNSEGLILEEMETVLEEQGYHCFLCPIPAVKIRLAKDHDHRENCTHNSHTVCPNCFRGFLCLGCNVRMGAIELNPEWANEKEILYLDRRPVLDLRKRNQI